MKKIFFIFCFLMLTSGEAVAYKTRISTKDAGAEISILKGDSSFSGESYQLTSLMYVVAREEKIELIEPLMKTEDINAKSKSGSNLLMFAVRLNPSLEVTKYLVSKGFDVNFKNKSGFTPLMWASYNPNPEIAKFLIQQGADVNAAGDKQRTPLIFAAQAGNLAVMNMLLENGANPGATDVFGKTAASWYEEVKK